MLPFSLHLPPLAALPGIILALASIAYLVVALRAVARFRPAARNDDSSFRPPVTVLIPVYGAPPGLYDCLASVCRQDYGEFQVIIGLHSPDDPARPVIEELIRAHPRCAIDLVIDGRMIGANPKNCNLANTYTVARHNVIVMVDSDVRVERDFLATVVAPLADPAVGGVTCLYRAAASGGFPSRLGALAINDWFIPSALVDVGRRDMDICYGAAIAVTRRALETIGGFSAMASAVAQDFVFGQRLAQHGFGVRLADCVVETIITEPDLATLFRHELRWNRAVRACRPLDHMLSLVMQSLPLSAVLLMLPQPSLPGMALIATQIALRIALHGLVRRRIPIPGPARPWLVPVRECLCFAVWVTSYFTRRVRWGRLTMQVDRNFSMTKLDERGQ